MSGSSPRKILIAMDGSKHSEYALNYYKQHIYRDGDDVIVVYAAEHGTIVSQPVFSMDPQLGAQLAHEEDGDIKKLVTKITKMMEDAGVKGRVQRYSGNTPGEAVIKAATELSVTMIVTGTRGLGTIRRTIMGSVSQYIVHHSHVPVLICREK